ncbi:MAG: HAD-IA family hydrolase [Gammaproteobacteria bacterium]|nr:HAD-IA family hydrolase [Gammaproteobacteria bacterium]
MNTLNPLPYKLLIFDWDGTLMDSVARIVDCLKVAGTEVGFEARPETELRNVIGLGLREALCKLYPDQSDTLIETMAGHYRQQYLEINNTPSKLFPGVEQLLHTLENRGYWLAVATGKGREGLDQVLDHTGLRDRFHTTRCASETFSKPHPRMLEEILEQTGLEAKDALMIGDTEYDLEMANNAGMASLGVSYGVHSVERLLKHKPIACLDDVSELHPFLQTL